MLAAPKVSAAEKSKSDRSFFPKKVRSDSTFFQPKLTIGPPNDVYEQEADAMADKVMRMEDGDQILQPKYSISSIQRKCAECEEGEEPAQRKESSGSQAEAPSVVHDLVPSGGGKKLDDNARSFMQNRFGYDFSSVKIHDDTVAVKSAQSINALAYTSGNNIVFNKGQYAPGTNRGNRLLAHELTHTIQQGATTSPVVQREDDPRITEIKERLKNGGKLTEEDVAYLKQHIGQEVVRQLLGGNVGQIIINFDSSRKPEDIHRRFRGRLDLKLSGAFHATAASLEGTASADIDLDAILAKEQATITISPPTENNRLSAMIRELLFPNNGIRTFDFPFSKDYFKYAGAVSLFGSITLSLTGPDTKNTAGMIKVRSASVPNGVELILTLSSTARETSVRDTERKIPGNHWMLTPNPRLFSTIGYSGRGGSDAFGTTIGADFPLAYDTKNPLIYAGLGARGSFNSDVSGSVGGTAFVGLNFDPLLLQLGFGAGAMFLPKPILTPDGPAQTFVYTEVEGMAAYRVIPNLDLVLMLSAGGGKDLPAYGTAQLGAGYHF
jgi:hypothetical protein